MAIMNPYNYKKPSGVSMPQIQPNQVQQDAVAVTTTKTKADVYLEQKIMNARPEELTLMLYDGLVRFINQAMLFNEQKSFDKSNTANLRAQAIIQELRSSLNLDIEMSSGLEDLYIFMIMRLIDANLEKNNEILTEVLELATDLRDTWKQAMNL